MNKTVLSYIFQKTIFGILFISLLSFNGNATDYYVNDNDTSGDIYCVSVGAVYNVASNDGLSNDEPLLSLAAVIAAHGPGGNGMIASGDVFYIDAGMYYQTDANLGINLDNISIIGAGSQWTVFDNDAASSDANRWANIYGDGVLIQGVFLTGYNYGLADAIVLQIDGATNFTINDVMVNENLPGGGSAAIFITGGSTGTFNGGGASCNPPNPSVVGGGVNIEGDNNVVTFNNYTLAGNSKDLQGGGAMRINGNATTIVTINNSLIEDNYTVGAEGGGGIMALNGCQVTISGSCFNNNRASTSSSINYGGAIMVGEGSDLTISNCSFDGNYASSSGNGGAIAINSDTGTNGGAPSITLSICSFTNNSATDGNDLYTRGANGESITADQCTWSATASEELHIDAGTITTTNSGSPSQTGGAVSDGIAATLFPSTVCPASGVVCYSVLPVEFIDFSIACENEAMKLNWSTASERNNDYFKVYYSNDYDHWHEALNVKGKGNTQSRSDYSVILSDAEPGYYKLTQTDFDGKTTELKSVFAHECSSDLNIIGANYSQSGTILLTYSTDADKEAEIQLIDNMGKLIYTTDVNFSSANNRLEMDAPRHLSNGLYFINVLDNHSHQTKRFSITSH